MPGNEISTSEAGEGGREQWAAGSGRTSEAGQEHIYHSNFKNKEDRLIIKPRQ